MNIRDWMRRFGPRPPPGVTELAEEFLGRCDGRPRTRRDDREYLSQLTSPQYTAPPPYEQAADLALRLALGKVWHRGWQPTDIWRITRRRLDNETAEFVVGGLAAEAEQYAEATMHPRWRAQLAELGAVVWWNPSEPYVSAWARRREKEIFEVLELVFRLLRLLRTLPSVPLLMPRPGSRVLVASAGPEAVDPKILAKVRALLAKAESTQFAEEADAFFAKAQELMSRYSLERAALDAMAGDDGAVIRTSGRRIWLDSPYLRPKSMLVNAVAQANRCRAVYADLGFLTVVGEDTDTEIVEVLSTSLLMQADKAMLAAGRHVDERGQSRTKSFRQAFLVSYAKRIGERLTEAATYAESMLTESLGHGRLLPVLRAKERAVEERFREMFPRLAAARSISVSSSAGWIAGRAAADLAVLDVHRAVRGKAQ